MKRLLSLAFVTGALWAGTSLADDLTPQPQGNGGPSLNEDVSSMLGELAAQTGIAGGWAGTIRGVDICTILVEEWSVADGNRLRYQARLVSGEVTPDPVFYDIVSVEGGTITLGDGTVLVVEGDTLVSGSSPDNTPRHRCK